MAEKTKKQVLIKAGSHQLITVDPSLPSLEGHTYFEKKASLAKETLKKAGLPAELLQVRKRRG